MKAISASIIVSAGLISFTIAAFIGHADTQLFVMFAIGIATLVAMWTWLREMFSTSKA